MEWGQSSVAIGQKVLLAIKSIGGESTEAWRTVLDDLVKRGLVSQYPDDTAVPWRVQSVQMD